MRIPKQKVAEGTSSDDARTAHRREREIARAFLTTAARLLHRHGTPAHRLEDTLTATARALGMRLQVFATPTSVELAFGGRRQRAYMIRGDVGEAELGRLVALGEVIAQVADGDLDPAQGRRELGAVARAGALYGPAATVLAFGLASGGAARVFDGNLADIGVSFVLGLILGLVSLAAGRSAGLGRLFVPLAAFLAASLSLVGAAACPGVHDHITTLSALIVLVPGLSLTLALTELATRHLVSGTARLAGAMTVFMTIAFGVGVARAIAAQVDVGALVFPDQTLVLPELWTAPLGEASRLLALVTAPIGFCILFQARWTDLPAIAFTGGVAAELAAVVGGAAGPELGAFVGAAVVGLAANTYAAWRRVPAAVVVLPSLLLLVPGAVGFQSVTLLLAHDPSAGIEAGFQMLVVAVALVAGLLAANLVNLPHFVARADHRAA